MSEITNQVSDQQPPVSELRSPNRSASRLPAPVRITEQVWPEGTVPVVSILCVTYNHIDFIRDAVEGFLMQETTFPVEIVIHDDASTDGTAEIVKEYAEKYPQVFRTILQKKNLYSSGNLPNGGEMAQRYCHGEFIALCEGDDYWISKEKLQKQITILEDNAEYSMTFHESYVIRMDGTKEVYASFPENKTELTTEELLQGCPVTTNSVMLRRDITRKVPEEFAVCAMGDWPLWLTASLNGKINYDNCVQGVYRKHSGGVWAGSTIIPALGHVIQFLSIASRVLPLQYLEAATHGLVAQFGELVFRAFKENTFGVLSKSNIYIKSANLSMNLFWSAMGVKLIKFDFLGKVGSRNNSFRELALIAKFISKAARVVPCDGNELRHGAARSFCSQAWTLKFKRPLLWFWLVGLAFWTSPFEAIRQVFLLTARSFLGPKKPSYAK